MAQVKKVSSAEMADRGEGKLTIDASKHELSFTRDHNQPLRIDHYGATLTPSSSSLCL